MIIVGRAERKASPTAAASATSTGTNGTPNWSPERDPLQATMVMPCWIASRSRYDPSWPLAPVINSRGLLPMLSYCLGDTPWPEAFVGPTDRRGEHSGAGESRLEPAECHR